MQLIALNDRVIVKRDPLPTNYVELTDKKDVISSRTGVILSVGPAANKDNAGLLQLGLRVYFNKFSGLNVTPDDDDLIAVAASELLAIEGFDPEPIRLAAGSTIIVGESA